MKRLRENAMLEAEISVNGDVFVEGHHMGQLAGFRFTPISGMEGSDAKAVEAAAHRALGLEFEARAARLHAAGNSDLAISADGLVRWLGDPVAKLVGADHMLHPRVILLADEQLTGAARDHVVARIERFVNHHISTILKSLDDLSRAEDLQGLAKGLAYQLVENLGVLFRRDVSDDVKSLDQDARASMRRYGVRFGAYHIFMPALLKPAPAELITLLWALKNDGLDKPGYGDLIPVLAAGRTSVVTDPGFERMFYKLAGFRFLGKRAVRIDILERLADLIRPLLQWKPGSPQRPDGAYDGRRFTTTTAMLSILGATPDDMEEILKGLGYRADSVTAEEAEAFLAAQAGSSAPAEEKTAEAGEVSGENGVAEAADEDAASAESDAGEAPGVAQPVGEEGTAPAEAAVAPVDEAAVSGEPATEEAVAAEPKPVLLWRPGGRADNQRGARPAGDRQRQGNRGPNRAPAEGQGEGKRDERRRDGEGGRGRDRDGGRGGSGPKGDRSERQDRGERKDRPNNRPDRDPKSQPARFEAKPPRKEKPIDPDSPFAKLAALKEQMKK